jgi:signal transduction histidine kinase
MAQQDTGHIALQSVEIFEGLPESMLGAIRGFMDRRDCPAGTVLFSEGERADAVFFVRQGTVQILKTSGGKSEVLATRGRGEVIGEMALFDSTPRFATAICESDCQVFVLSRARFFELLPQHPSIAERIMRIMSQRVREADVRRLDTLEAKTRELENARLRLEASLRYRERVLACAPYPIIVADPQNRIQLANHAAQRLFGHPNRRSLWEWLQPADPGVVAEARARLEAGLTWKSELELEGVDGGQMFCTVTAVPIADTGDGRPARLWILEDQAEMRALQSRALDRERLALKGEMAGEIAHELNNYLAVLMGNVELLPMFMGGAVPPPAERALANIQQALAQVAVFTDNLLRSRHPAGQKTEIQLNEFLENQIAFLRPQKRMKKAVIQTQWAEGIPPLECDASGLQQVFYNLMLNAADALAEGNLDRHTIYVSTRYDAERECAIFVVEDDGPGIPPDVLPRMFKERVSSKPTGHGFGLLTIARIIQEHGGTITPGARAGGGARFVITLPIGRAR